MPPTPSRSAIGKACRLVAQEYDLFHGNCAAFAVALLHVIGQGSLLAAGCPREEESSGFAHVAYQHPDGTLFDGSGVISRRQLLAWARRDYTVRGERWPEPDLIDPWCLPGDPEQIVLSLTTPRVPVKELELALRLQLPGGPASSLG